MGEDRERVQEEERLGGGGGAAPTCDFCEEAKALVYCRADTARLCLACDRHVHSANTVSSKHPRSLLCDSCASYPSSILLSFSSSSSSSSSSDSDCCGQLLLCSNCDFEAKEKHGDGVRRPVEPFSGYPTAVELVSILGVGGDVEKEALLKKKQEIDEIDEIGRWIWETPQVVRLDDLILPTPVTAATAFRSIAIPPFPKPKNQNLACGKQKNEILRQLRELVTSDTQFNSDHEDVNPVTEFHSLLPSHNSDQPNFLVSDFNLSATLNATANSEMQARELQWDQSDWKRATDSMTFPYEVGQIQASLALPSVFPNGVADYQTSEYTASGSDRDSGHHVVKKNISQVMTKPGVELLCPDRDSVILRYKEKRKTRRYEKLIRYESRKARADSRVRIRGRFAKANQVPKP